MAQEHHHAQYVELICKIIKRFRYNKETTGKITKGILGPVQKKKYKLLPL